MALPACQVMDNLVASLSRYTQLLNPAAAKPAIAFGESEKARLAAEAVFTIATRFDPGELGVLGLQTFDASISSGQGCEAFFDPG